MSRSRHVPLLQAILDPGFTPADNQLEELLDLLAASDEKTRLATERALARLGPPAGEAARDRLLAAEPPLRGSLCRVVGRVAAATGDKRLIAMLVDLLRDEDPRTRRYAATALGKLPLPRQSTPEGANPPPRRSLGEGARSDGGGRRAATEGATPPPRRSQGEVPAERAEGATPPPRRSQGEVPAERAEGAILPPGAISTHIERALIEAWHREPAIEQRRALAAALGKVGGTDALALLRSVTSEDGELARIVAEARLKVERTLARTTPARIASEHVAPAPVAVWLHCRSGLEEILVQELGPAFQPRIAKEGLVQGILAGPLKSLESSRTWLRFGFPLSPRPCGGPGERPRVVAEILTSPEALAIFETWTEGIIRYRVEWAGAGHRRSETWRCVREVGRLCPSLVNDSTESLWEAVVAEQERRLAVEIWPRGLHDGRFFYRKRDIPAASHPTLAAALARLGDVRPDDLVWDPFVGSAAELVERGLLGPYGRLLGSDLDQRALQAARLNLEASGLTDWELVQADARVFSPSRPPTLVITNPPMGRRVLERKELVPLYRSCIERFAGLLAPSGRFIWISPLFEQTVAMARRAGLIATYRKKVDMGGFSAEIQRFVKQAGPAVRSGVAVTPSVVQSVEEPGSPGACWGDP
ncbi:MAG: HEAT repeat domain-containing protein [Bradymonadales bacterium]|nr:HEAT repeat domain-containing protein [Bradymonadales bacterium]